VRRALRLWGPVAAWMAVIFAASSRRLPGYVAVLPDWSTHSAAFAALSILCCRALAGGLGPSLRSGDALLAVVFSAAYGVSDEYHQSFVPGRDATAWDVAKDAVGAVIGAWLYARVIVPRFGIQHREAHRG
jgi:VanZ family protein